jgi:predicted DNA binding CopG/RHH family protein
MTIIKDWDQVPRFTGDREEAVFWGGARVDVRLMEASVVAGNTANESVTITLRMDPRMLARVKRIARSRFLNYQSMIKQWLSERMERETNTFES